MRYLRPRSIVSVLVAIAFSAISLWHVPSMLTAPEAASAPCHEQAGAASAPSHQDTPHDRALPDRVIAGCPLATLPPPPDAPVAADPRAALAWAYACAAMAAARSADLERPDPPPRAAA